MIKKGYKHSAETRERMRISSRKRWDNIAERRRHGRAIKGKKRTAEQNENQSLRMKEYWMRRKEEETEEKQKQSRAVISNQYCKGEKYYFFRKYLLDIGLSTSRIEDVFNAIRELHLAYCDLDNNNFKLLNRIGITQLTKMFAELEELRIIEIK